jgi:predicted RNase H-like nuclease
MPVIGGADGCPGGWISVERDTNTGECSAVLSASPADLLERSRHLAILTIDIPIGLTDAGPRTCDLEARRLLGRRRASSVFPAPVRAALEGADYRDACARSAAACGKRLSKQAFAIMWRIKEMDALLRSEAGLQRKVREVHPEVCFAAWGGSPMSHRKSTVSGRGERLLLVNQQFPNAFDRFRPLWRKAQVADDDLLDAFAALWTAERIIDGGARTIPELPPEDRFGLRMEMVM